MPKKALLIFEKQWLHALALAVLLALLVGAGRLENVRAGHLWGVSTAGWMWTAVSLAVAHQTFVWLCWRTQLHLSLITRTFGKLGFELYAVLFSVLGVSRIAAAVLLAISNRGTIPLSATALRILALILAVPALYVLHSVKRHFRFRRAFGIDHFDPAARARPFVREGVFRLTSNAMYVFGFAVYWIPALWYGSAAGLCVAFLCHAYIWVHYFATERPDMRRIYAFSSHTRHR